MLKQVVLYIKRAFICLFWIKCFLYNNARLESFCCSFMKGYNGSVNMSGYCEGIKLALTLVSHMNEKGLLLLNRGV